jgi:hypothetical protein
MMLARKDGARLCRAATPSRRLLRLLPLIILLAKAPHIEAAGKPCDSACRECKKSCSSQKLDCLRHAGADRTSGGCAPGRSGRPCRTVARQTFIRARFECRQAATACRSCCYAPPGSGCVTTTTVMTPTTSTTTATAPASTTTSTTTTATTTTTAPTGTTFPTCSELLGHCGASSCSGGCVAHQPDNALECVDTSTCQFPFPCSSDADCAGGGACFSDGSGHTACCTSGCACTPASCLGSTTTTTVPAGCSAATVGSDCGSPTEGCGCTVLCSDNCAPQCMKFAFPTPFCQTDADCAPMPGARCVTDHPVGCSATSGSCLVGAARCLEPCAAPTTTTTTTTTSANTTTTTAPGSVCCTDNMGACIYRPSATDCMNANGTPGAPGTMCDCMTGTCAPPPAAAGNCCENLPYGGCVCGPDAHANGCTNGGGTFVGGSICSPSGTCGP